MPESGKCDATSASIGVGTKHSSKSILPFDPLIRTNYLTDQSSVIRFSNWSGCAMMLLRSTANLLQSLLKIRHQPMVRNRQRRHTSKQQEAARAMVEALE